MSRLTPDEHLAKKFYAVVTGDVSIDWNLAYQPPTGADPWSIWSPQDQGRLAWQCGGALLLGEVIKQLAECRNLESKAKETGAYSFDVRTVKVPSDELVSPGNKDYHHSYALWDRDKPDEKNFPSGPLWFHDRADEDWGLGQDYKKDAERSVWRIKQFLGFNRNGDILKEVEHDMENASIVVLDDADYGFRKKISEEEFWPKAMRKNWEREEKPWVILKITRNVAEGDLLTYLLDKFAEKMIVVLPIRDLRSTAPVLIPPRLSWECTAENLRWELDCNPKLKKLQNCRYLVISLGTAGAMLKSKEEPVEESVSRLYYDPRCLEDEWENPRWNRMMGYTVALTVSLARQVMLAVGEPSSGCKPVEWIGEGIRLGINAMRELYRSGYRCRDSGYKYQYEADPKWVPALHFPSRDIARYLETIANSLTEASVKPVNAPIELDWIDIPEKPCDLPYAGNSDRTERLWTILYNRIKKEPSKIRQERSKLLEDRLGHPPSQHEFEVWEDVLRFGEKAQEIGEGGLTDKKIPIGQVGDLTMIDRREIEAVHGIKGLIQKYSRSREIRPLNLAVFGPPGSGKSYAVEQVAGSVSATPEARSADDCTCHDIQIETIKFNLSQFQHPEELHAALHQVRDKGLSGKLPLVVWDEFDTALGTQRLGWLRYFLAPMQDGEFVENQIIHPIGRCIFVFAGGTCRSWTKFEKQRLTKDVRRTAKVPDFISRLHGCLDVFGINPNDDDDEKKTPLFLIRRAVSLRSLLWRDAHHLFEEPRKPARFIPNRSPRGRLLIDFGVLMAFLWTKGYRHGVRSMRAIIADSDLRGKRRFDQSSLPSKQLLSPHLIDADDFERILMLASGADGLLHIATGMAAYLCDSLGSSDQDRRCSGS